MDRKKNQTPNWLCKNSDCVLPEIYERVWEHVKEDRGGASIDETNDKYLVDTNKVFPLLLTSQLPTQVLGFIWSLANKKYSGQLTQQELYIVLALIALAQTSCTFTNLDILFMLPGPPTPTLNLPVVAAAAQIHRREAEVDLTDDFTEFQSAPVVVGPSTLPRLDPKLGSAIGSRLANHNLSGPKKLPDKSTTLTTKKSNQSTKFTNFTKDLATLNKNFLDCERLTRGGGIFPNCIIKNEAKTVILKDTLIRNNTSIPVERSSTLEEIATRDLMNLQTVEDKYSALRILIDEPEQPDEIPAPPDKDNDKDKDEDYNNLIDDFGDFVSAGATETNQLDKSMDLFSDFENLLQNGNDKSEISLVQETIEAFAQLEINSSPEKTLDYLEEKYDATIDPDKIIQRDFDTISTNSEFRVLNRCGSVQSLDLKSCLPSAEPTVDNDNENANMHQAIYWEWKQYMESCVLLLQLAANIFTSITSNVVLQEVLNSAQGYSFLCNLAEVAGVCRRVNFSHKEMDINIMGFDDLLMDIDKIWAEMEPFYINIPIVTELPAWPPTYPAEPAITATCCLCLTIITSGKIRFNDSNYHATCANLWLNCVSNNLPILNYTCSSNSTHSHAMSTCGNQ